MRRISSDLGDSDDQFLILATWEFDSEKATTLYERRWEIETMFAALKSRGYRLEETHLTAPDRVRRLIGLLGPAFAWTSVVGENRASREGPSRKVTWAAPTELVPIWTVPTPGNFDHTGAPACCLPRLPTRTSKSYCIFVLLHTT